MNLKLVKDVQSKQAGSLQDEPKQISKTIFLPHFWFKFVHQPMTHKERFWTTLFTQQANVSQFHEFTGILDGAA